jgi:2-keto-3-deoxy-L-rhamnonate aldolase RhmA
MIQPKAEKSPFHRRLKGGDTLLGTFIKIPTTHSTEIIGSLGFDFVIVDQEHSNFDRLSIDAALLAARATGIAALVRVPDVSHILPALDSGASGVLVPHVDSAGMAHEAMPRQTGPADMVRPGWLSTLKSRTPRLCALR